MKKLLLLFALLFSCGDKVNNPSDIIMDPLELNQVQYWAYQIQALDEPGAIDALAASKYDMLVIEPTRTELEQYDFDTKGMVNKLKASRTFNQKYRKLVIAYIDIGEAESWRWYWTWPEIWNPGEPRPEDWPEWIVYHDPDGWDDNYPVIYWHEQWKDIVIYGKKTGSDPNRNYSSIIDELIKDGFDGAYLDWVEAYDDDEIKKIAAKTGKDTKVEMVNLIKEIRDYAKKRNPQFLIIQQNASGLFEGHPELINYIDAIAQEAIWYDGTGGFDQWDDPDGYDIKNPEGLTGEYLYNLDQYKNVALPVFTVDYAVKHANEIYKLSRAKKYIPYCTRRSLQKLTSTPPY